jgi:hypothetical protein
MTINSQNLNHTTGASIVTDVPKKPKVFIIKKYVKYEEIIKEFCGEDENSETDKKPKKSKIAKEKRIKLIKYNNKKLSNLEKVEKLKILSKVVRRYRRKIKNIRKKIKQNSEKIFARYLNKKLIKDKKNPKKEQNTIALGNFIVALKKLRNGNNTIEFSEDKKALENIISLIASGKLKPDSIQFKKICTQIRMLINEDKIKQISKHPKIFINLPEKNIYITKKELDFYKKAGNDENVFRAILGFKQTPTHMNEDNSTQETNIKNQGIFDPILAGLINKNMMDSDEFCNNLFNTDIPNCNNVFTK